MITSEIFARRTDRGAGFFRCFPAALVVLGLLASASMARAQASIFANAITDTNPSASNPYTNLQTFDPNITVSGIGRASALTASSAANRYSATNFTASGTIDTTKYFTFTLTPNSGFSINFDTLTGDWQHSGTGPTTFSLRSSLDSFGADIGTGSLLTSNTSQTAFSFSLTSTAFDNVTTPITFRIYGYGGSSTGGTFSINDFVFNGVVASSGGSSTFNYFDVNGSTAGSGVTTGSTYTFSSGTNFNSVADGTGTTGAFTSGSTATFTAGSDAGTANYTVNVDTAVTTSGIIINSGNLTLAHAAGGSITLTGPSINVASGATGLISEAIGGTVGLTKDGAGTLTLSSTTSSFTGSVTVDNGILSIGADANLGTTTTNGIVLAGGTLQTTTSFSLNAGRALSGSGTIDTGASPNVLTIPGSVSTTALIVQNTGTISITGTGGSQAVGSVTFNAAGTIANTGSTLAVGNVTTATTATGVATISGPISLASGTHTFNIVDGNTSGTDLALTGSITGTGTLSKAATTSIGTLALGGDNSAYSGTITLGGVATASGTVSITNALALGSGTFNLDTGTLSNDTGAPLSTTRGFSIGATTAGTGAVLSGSDLSIGGAVSLFKGSSPTTAQQLLVVNNNTTITSNFVVSTGTGTSTGLTISGTGHLTLNPASANTFVEPITVSGATVEAAAAGALAANTGVTVTGGGTLLLSGAGNRINDAAAITLSTGTYASQGNSETTGALTLSATSNIDFGTGSNSSVITFADSSGKTWSGTLSLLNYTDSADILNFTSSTGLTSTQLGEITYTSGGTTYVGSGLDGSGDVLFTPVPEPATVLGGILMVGAFGFSQRRRVRGLFLEARVTSI